MDEPHQDFFAPAGRGLQHNSLRSANRRAILTSIATNLGSSIADLSRLTGLAPQTASSIVTRLEADGLVQRGEVLRGRRGQPATPLFLAPDGAFSIGVEIGWRHLEVILSNLRLEVIERYRREYSFPDAHTVVEEVADTIRSFVGALPAAHRGRVAGIGLASPTGVGRGFATIAPPDAQARLWDEIDLRAALEEAAGLPVSWFNDGNAGCWAELVALPQPRPADLVYLHIGTFVSAGIVAEHTLWEGRSGNSANLGAMLVRVSDGYAPAHLTASLFALGNRLQAAGIALPAGNPRNWPWADLEPVVSAWLTEAAGTLAQIIANAAAVFEFDIAVIDGTLPRDLVGRLVTETRAWFDRLPVLTLVMPELVAGRFGGEAPSRGAAALVVYRRYFSRHPERMPG